MGLCLHTEGRCRLVDTDRVMHNTFYIMVHVQIMKNANRMVFAFVNRRICTAVVLLLEIMYCLCLFVDVYMQETQCMHREVVELHREQFWDYRILCHFCK